ncbi:MAG: methyltransferase domain-containing protein [Chloroflexi bacterium]|nr:methyltransferase domain-containing protein [Chloroflexota bacterium]
MSETTVAGARFSREDVPANYERLLVPHVFDPWARVLLDLAKVSLGESVLDVATGPGTVARLAAERVGPAGHVTGVDISRPMLEVARAKLKGPQAASVEFIESPAVPLPVPDGTIDLVTCQQGLQFFPNRDAALAEMLRVLKPGGRLAVALWAGTPPIPRQAIRQFLAAEGFDVPIPVYPDPQELRSALLAAGFSAVTCEPATLAIEWESAEQVFETFPTSEWASRLAKLSAERQQAALDVARAEILALVQDGKVRYETRANIGLGRKPT